MKLSELIVHNLPPKVCDKDNFTVCRLHFHKLITYCSLLVLLTLGIVFLASGNSSGALVYLTAFLLVIANQVVFPPSKRIVVSSWVLLTILGVVFIYNFYFLSQLPNVQLFILIYPLLAFALLDINAGVVFSLILPISFLPSLLMREIFPIPYIAIRFFISIFAIYTILILISMLISFRRKKEVEYLKQAIESSEKSTQEKNEFIAQLSHQLRTSLSNILLVNNLVNSSSFDEKQKDLIDTLQASTNNLAETVNKIIDMSQHEAVELHESTISFDLGSTMESILKLFRKQERLSIDLLISENL